LRGRVEATQVFGRELSRLRERRELGGVEDLIGVGVADAGEDARVGEGALKCVIFGNEGLPEVLEAEGKDVQAAGVELGEGCLSLNEVQGGAAFRPGFGEDEGAVGEVEGGEIVAATEFGSGCSPVEAAGDHQVEDQEELAVKDEDDAFADAAKGKDLFAFERSDGWERGAEEEGAGDAEVLDRLAEDAGREGGEVGRDVGELWHWRE